MAVEQVDIDLSAPSWGQSGDAKPSVSAGKLFYEADTKKWFMRLSSTWIEIDKELLTMATYAPTSLSSEAQGRLTLTSALAVLITAVTASANVYYTPYKGNQIPIWNGSFFQMMTFTELTNVLANSTTGKAGPAAGAASKNYDMFVWNDAGTIRLTRGAAWNSDTARSSTTENDLQRVNGTLCNLNAITNGPAAGYGTYVGTIRTDSGGATVSYLPGSTAAAGGEAFIGIWNFYNRVEAKARLSNSDAAWTYSSATIRAAAGSNTMRVSMIRGINEDGVDATYFCYCQSPATLNSAFLIGFGLDATNSMPFAAKFIDNAAAALGITLMARYTQYPGLGFHFLSANEQGDGSATFTIGGSGFNSLGYSLRY